MAQERLRSSGAHPHVRGPLLYATVGKTPSILESGTQDILPPIPHCLSPWLTQEPLPCLPHPLAALSHPGSLPSNLLSHACDSPIWPHHRCTQETQRSQRQLATCSPDGRGAWGLVEKGAGRGDGGGGGRCQGEGGIGIPGISAS